MLGDMMGTRGVYLILGFLICCLGLVTFRFYGLVKGDVTTSVELTRSILKIERGIGYGGFIHHFKNHVLRPSELVYAERARASYQLATDEIKKLQLLVNSAGIHVDLTELQSTLDRYGGSIDGIRKAHLLGIPIAEIDKQYVVSDKDAAFALSEIQLQVEQLLEKRRRSAAHWAWLSFLLFLVVVISLLVGMLITWRQQQSKREREREYLRQEEELKQDKKHADELEKLVRELERSNRELDGFAYTASHDLKEPMRGIAINAKFLSRENVSEKGRERIDRMIVLTTRMDQLISDILFFSRLGRGGQESEDIDPVNMINWIGAELREWLLERGGEIKIIGELPKIRAERSKVKTVLQNLIVNGLKYNISERKMVEIGFQSKVEVDGVILRDVYYVRDNGIGIAESNREKIFRIFSRLNRESDYGSGTGAGLSFVRKIVEDYGYEITFISQLGKGTTFYYSLPLVGPAT